jgi:hypothetical protein
MRPTTGRTLEASMRHRPPPVTRDARRRQLPTVPSHAVPTGEYQSDCRGQWRRQGHKHAARHLLPRKLSCEIRAGGAGQAYRAGEGRLAVLALAGGVLGTPNLLLAQPDHLEGGHSGLHEAPTASASPTAAWLESEPRTVWAIRTAWERLDANRDPVHPEATAAVLAANQFNTPPPAGSQDVMVAVSATYNGSDSSHLDSRYALRAVGAANVAYTTFYNSCGVLPEPNLEFTDPEVFTGGTVSGNAACWVVPSSDVSSLVMYTAPVGTSQQVFFALH